jgi:hypothetical protein
MLNLKFMIMNKRMLISLLLLFPVAIYAQPTWTSISNGDWNSPATWQASDGASNAPPQTLKDFQQVIITNGFTVTLNDDLILEDHAYLRIENGGVLKMGASPDDAPTFTMKSPANQFYIYNGTFESMIPGTGGNMLLEAGFVDWQDANIYISGNFTVKDEVNSFQNINVCVRVAQDIQFEGVGSAGSYAVMSDAFYASALEGSGNLTIKDNSFISSTGLRLNGSATTSNVELFSSFIEGDVYSINAGQKLVINGMTGSPSLDYWCAPEIDSNLNSFTGPKIQDCSIAGEVCEEVFVGISEGQNTFRNEIGLYPNPAQETIYLTGIENYDTVEIYDLNGKLYVTFAVQNNDNLKLEISSLNSGIYLVKMVGSDNTTIKKLIKD